MNKNILLYKVRGDPRHRDETSFAQERIGLLDATFVHLKAQKSHPKVICMRQKSHSLVRSCCY